MLDDGQSRQLEFSVTTHGWNNSNRSNKSSDQKVFSRATPISGNTFDTSNNFNVIADVNHGGNWSTEVNNENVSYSTANKIWQTSATHYWPESGSTVIFYAYYPTSISSSIAHTAGSAPVFSYTVPDNATDQIDILASAKTSVTGNSYNQIPVDFKHIFAAVNFQVGTSGMPSGTITGVTLNNIQYKGTYSLDDTWTQNTTDKKSFSQTVSVPTSTGTAITSDTTTFMMMPQTLSNASITVTYSNGGTLTKTIIGTWEAGKTYTYNLSKTIPVSNFDYTGNVQSYTVPLTGTYKLEVWGAQGGDMVSSPWTGKGGKGGYAAGTKNLQTGTILYVYVGGQGEGFVDSIANHFGGWNGGGTCYQGASGGGGATDIRTVSGTWNNSVSLNNRIIVGGGGGGSNDYTEGGCGGGLVGGNGLISATETNATLATGGTQTSGGTGWIGGSFGIGGGVADANGDGGAGGGGWYGGAKAAGYDASGAGGSSYIGGITNGQTIAGDSSMPAPSGGTEIGHFGNGYARITFISAN